MAFIIYAATDEGVIALRSEDGQSWKVENRGLEEWAVCEVAVLPSAPNRVFAGTRGDGVWLSEDFGKNWKKPCYGKPGPGKVRCLTMDPGDPNTLYAGTEPIDVFVTHDGAKSWTRLDAVRKVPWVETVDYPVSTVEPHVRDIAIDPKNTKTLYASLQVGYMLKSTDGGQSWTLLDKGVDADIHTVVIHPNQTNRLFVSTGGHDYRLGRSQGRALYISQDSGATWTPTAMDFQQEYSVPLVIHPKNPDILYSSLANGQPSQWRKRQTGAEALVIRTKDGGKTWQKLNGQLAEASADFTEALVIDQADPNRLYAALRSGTLYASQDSGESWKKLDVKVPALSDMKTIQA